MPPSKPCTPHSPPWTLREIAEQALVLYEGNERDGKECGCLQSEQFWGSHARTRKAKRQSR